MNKPFWKQGGVAKILKNPRQTLKKTLRAVKGFKPEGRDFHQDFAASLIAWEKGLEVLDWTLPIREGHSQIDIVAINSARELVFIWIQERCDAAAIAKLLPDYDWIQKNRALWPHLFPQIMEARSFQMTLRVFATEIDPEVKFLLRYLEGIRFRLFQASRDPSAGAWSFTTWSERQKILPQVPVLPSSPGILTVGAGLAPARRHSARGREHSQPYQSPGPLLTADEINDLVRIHPPPELGDSDENENTDPHYELP